MALTFCSKQKEVTSAICILKLFPRIGPDSPEIGGKGNKKIDQEDQSKKGKDDNIIQCKESDIHTEVDDGKSQHRSEQGSQEGEKRDNTRFREYHMENSLFGDSHGIQDSKNIGFLLHVPKKKKTRREMIARTTIVCR